MKKRLMIILVLLSAFRSYSQQFTVKGKLSGINEQVEIILDYRGETQKLLSKDGTFEFKGNSFPTDASLKILPHHPKLTMVDSAYWEFFAKKQHLSSYRDFFLEGHVIITGKSLTDAIVGGSKEQDLYESFRTKLKVLENEMSSLPKSDDNENAENKEDSEDETTEAVPVKRTPAEEEVQKKINELKIDFVQKHPNSYFSLDLAKLESRIDPELFEKMVNTLGEPLQGSSLYKSLKSMVAGNKMGNIGNVAFIFTLPTAEGKELSLTSYKGKYVLLDFWASWCVPCRAENPNLVAAYNKFKHKNFDILSVSIDDKQDLWLKAVKEDQLSWSQVIDRKGSNSVATAYAVVAVPQNYLIDPNGKIVAKNLRAEELENTLEKFIK